MLRFEPWSPQPRSDNLDRSAMGPAQFSIVLSERNVAFRSGIGTTDLPSQILKYDVLTHRTTLFCFKNCFHFTSFVQINTCELDICIYVKQIETKNTQDKKTLHKTKKRLPAFVSKSGFLGFLEEIL